jgi:Tfp pilus assembly protein PilP
LIVEQIPETPEILVTPDPATIKTLSKKFDVKQLKVTGIILGGLGEYARVAAPDGKSYTLLVGTPVGTHDGEVISITDNVIIVKEIYRYESGKVEEVETPLYLKPIEEEEKS